MAQLLRVDAASKLKVLDIAAGHGMYGITVARHNPHAAVVAVDWPGVLLIARENAEAAGIADRWRPLPGSVFEIDLGTGYDLALVTGFLHHFDPPTNAALLRKIRNSLAPRGRVAIVEFVLDDDRVTPPPAALFPMTMLVTTRSGDAYTFAEYSQMIANAGFTSCELHDIPNNFQRLIVANV